MKKYVVTYGQSLLDLAVELYGDATAVFLLADENPELSSIQPALKPGQSVRLRQQPVNPAAAGFFFRRNIRVNTDSGDLSDWLVARGYWEDVGFWRDKEYWIDEP